MQKGTPANGGMIEITGSGDAVGDTITIYAATNGGAAHSIGTTTVASNGGFDFTASAAFADGSYAITATDTSVDGTQVSALSAPATATVAAPAPTGLMQKGTPANGGMIEITGSGDAVGDTITIYAATNGGAAHSIGTTTVASNGGFDFTASGAFADGSYMITATDTSVDGTQVSALSAPATATVAAPAPTGLMQKGTPANGGMIEITGSGDAVGDTITIYAATNGGAAAAIGTTTVASGGTFDFTASGAFADSSYTITATDTSVDGTQVSALSAPATATVAATPPTNLAQKGTALNGGTIEITGMTTDSVGDMVKLYANGAVVGTGTVKSGGGFDIVTTTTFKTGTDSITATDTSVDGTQVSAMSAPVVATVISPVTITGSGATVSIVDPTISGTTDASGAGSTITLTIGQTVLGSTIVASDGSWSDRVLLPTDGTYTIVATDTVNGVTSSASDMVTLSSLPNQSLFGAITHDVTSAGGNIYALYETILGRAPDALGLENWVADLNSGTPLTTIAQDLLSSPEYASDYGSSTQSNAAFVNQLYQDGLHRSPDPSGAQTWTNALASGQLTRGQVAIDIATSQESQNDLAPTFQTGVFTPDATDSAIARLYYGLLDRAPDAGGLQGWEMAVHGGALSLTDVTQGILGSTEYQGTAVGQSNLGYIEGLYQTALGRTGEASAVQNYETALDTGTSSRADVANAFLESTEFQNDEAGRPTRATSTRSIRRRSGGKPNPVACRPGTMPWPTGHHVRRWRKTSSGPASSQPT